MFFYNLLKWKNIYLTTFLQCYIIDDFGYIFLSGDETDLGRHISDVDGALFHSLAEKDRIFSAQPIKDYQVNLNVKEKKTCIPCLLSIARFLRFFSGGVYFLRILENRNKNQK